MKKNYIKVIVFYPIGKKNFCLKGIHDYEFGIQREKEFFDTLKKDNKKRKILKNATKVLFQYRDILKERKKIFSKPLEYIYVSVDVIYEKNKFLNNLDKKGLDFLPRRICQPVS